MNARDPKPHRNCMLLTQRETQSVCKATPSQKPEKWGSDPISPPHFHNVFNGIRIIALSILSSSCIPMAAQESVKKRIANDNASTGASGTTSSVTDSSSSATAIASGARAAKIIFKESSTSGSFNSAPSNGTKNSPGNGHQAVRIFNADNSLLASGGPTASAWPKWITGVEVGISGPSNGGSSNRDCTRFSDTSEATSTTCDVDQSNGNASNIPCGAADGYLRVAEYECTRAATLTSDGNGGPNDGVYIRVGLSRGTAYFGSSENLMGVLEYSANSLNSGAVDPQNCIQNGLFNPANRGCADQVYQLFIKHNAYEVVQPFLMIAPPSINFVDKTLKKMGGGVGTKQFMIPLASDSDLKVIQISRIRALENSETDGDDFTDYCTSDGQGATTSSALCVGMVFYSLTLYRM